MADTFNLPKVGEECKGKSGENYFIAVFSAREYSSRAHRPNNVIMPQIYSYLRDNAV